MIMAGLERTARAEQHIRAEVVSIDRLKAGDKSEFERYYNANFDFVRNYTMSIIHALEDAEQITLDSFAKYWTKRESFSTFSEIRQFLFKCAKHDAIDLLRKKATFDSNRKDLLYLAQQEEELSVNETIGKEIRAEVMTKISQIIFTLPEQQQEIFRLIYFNDYSSKEVANILGISYDAARAQHSRMMKTFKKLFGDRDLMILSIISLAVYTILHLYFVN